MNKIKSTMLRIIALLLLVMTNLVSTLSYSQNVNLLGKHYFDATKGFINQGILLSYNDVTKNLEYQIKNTANPPYVPAFSMTLVNDQGDPVSYYTGKFMIDIESQQIASSNKAEFDHGLGKRDLVNWAFMQRIGPHAFPKTSLLLPTLNSSDFLLIHSGIKVWQDDSTIISNPELIPPRPETFTLPEFYDDFMKHDTYSDGIMATKFSVNSDNTIDISEELDEFRIGFGRYRSEIAACKHANGRDWWILAPKITHNLMSVFIYDLNEVTYVGEFPLSDGNTYSNPLLGSFVFSPDGSRLLRTHRRIRYYSPDPEDQGPDDILEIWEFDRCSGTVVEEPTVIRFPRPLYADSFPDKHIPFNTHFMYTGSIFGPEFLVDRDFVNFAGCFSDDGSKIYVANGIHIIQLDLNNNLQQDTLFTYDDISKAVKKFPSDDFGFLPTLPDAFWNLPNGKIVVGSNNVNSAVHIIHSPNLPGSLCQFEFEALQFKAPSENPQSDELYTIRGLPNFPHYHMTAVNDFDQACDDEEPTEPDAPQITIGPNPFSNQFTVNIPFSGFYTIEVFDIIGRNLLRQMLPSPTAAVGSIDIESSHLPVGVYIVVVDNLVTGDKKSFKVLKSQ